jgi:hypothetical protein
MGISASIFLIAIGAILAFAVDATVEGLDIVTVGWILMAIGAVGILLSLLAWESWGGFGRRRTVYQRTTVDNAPVVERPVAARRRTVVERDEVA